MVERRSFPCEVVPFSGTCQFSVGYFCDKFFFLTELHGENEVDTLLRALLFTLVPIAYDTQMSMSLRGAHGNGMNPHVPIIHQSIL